MRKLIILWILITASFSGYSQTKEKILAVLENQRQAWNNGDIESFMIGYWQSDSLLFVGKSGPNYGYDNTLANYKKSYPDKAAMGYLTFTILQVKEIDKSNAFVLGKWNLKRAKDEPNGHFTLLFKKIKGSWKIVVDHSS